MQILWCFSFWVYISWWIAGCVRFPGLGHSPTSSFRCKCFASCAGHARLNHNVNPPSEGSKWKSKWILFFGSKTSEETNTIRERESPWYHSTSLGTVLFLLMHFQGHIHQYSGSRLHSATVWLEDHKHASVKKKLQVKINLDMKKMGIFKGNWRPWSIMKLGKRCFSGNKPEILKDERTIVIVIRTYECKNELWTRPNLWKGRNLRDFCCP